MPEAESQIIENAISGFRSLYGIEPDFVAHAPGRVNLIGEHTDYNKGFVLPIALPFSTAIAVSRDTTNTVTLFSDGFGSAKFCVSDDPRCSSGWGKYVHGMSYFLHGSQIAINGWRGFVSTNIPTNANLSSSAALEVAAGLVIKQISELDVSLMDIALAGSQVENELLGLRSGVMDQIASAFAKEEAALLLDCRSLSYSLVSLPKNLVPVVMDTGTRRDLVGTEYNQRREACERVAKNLGVDFLRGITLDDLNSADTIDEVDYKRAVHVITENKRTLAAVQYLRENDLKKFGEVINASHISLRDLFEVTGPALDTIVELAKGTEGCLGARMTGGGFAGSALAIVEEGKVEEFCSSVIENWQDIPAQPAKKPFQLFPIKASSGASVLLCS